MAARNKTIKAGTKVRILDVTESDRFAEIAPKLVGLTGVVLDSAPGMDTHQLSNNGNNTYNGGVRLDSLPRGRGVGYVGDTIANKAGIHNDVSKAKTGRRDAHFDAVKVEIID